jgi:hypothetical protein
VTSVIKIKCSFQLILGDYDVINDTFVGSIVVNSEVSEFKGMWGSLDSRETITTVAFGTPGREWTSGVERDGQFIVTAVTDEVLESAGSIVIALGSDLTVENRVCSLKVVSVTAEVDVDLVLFQKCLKTMFTSIGSRIHKTLSDCLCICDAGTIGRR